MNADSPLMTVKEVAEFLRMSTSFVRQHANGLRRPLLPSLKLGKSVRFQRTAVQKWIREQERAA